MASLDLTTLLNMGFEEERAQVACKQSGGLQGALQWLEDNQDKDIEQIRSDGTQDFSVETDPSIEPPTLQSGETAKSLVCNECGKRFRSIAQAEAHGERTQHQDFSESVEELAPLTESEKKEKLAELKAKALERKRLKEAVDREETKKNEKIRMKSTQEVQTIKEDLEKKERAKDAAKKRQENIDDILAKKRVQDKIAADKEERRLKTERAKAQRDGVALPTESISEMSPTIVATANAPTTHTETRLRLQTMNGNIMKIFAVDTTLFEVAQALESDGIVVETFTMTYPKKVFQGPLDMAKSLKEAGLIPSAVLIVK